MVREIRFLYEIKPIAPFPKKPKLMRWHTYLRLRAESMALETKIWDVEHALLLGSWR
jgi:hypothetical protein